MPPCLLSRIIQVLKGFAFFGIFGSTSLGSVGHLRHSTMFCGECPYFQSLQWNGLVTYYRPYLNLAICFPIPLSNNYIWASWSPHRSTSPHLQLPCHLASITCKRHHLLLATFDLGLSHRRQSVWSVFSACWTPYKTKIDSIKDSGSWHHFLYRWSQIGNTITSTFTIPGTCLRLLSFYTHQHTYGICGKP